jgi:hypothetical protein
VAVPLLPTFCYQPYTGLLVEKNLYLFFLKILATLFASVQALTAMRSFAGTRPKLVANAVLSKAVQVFRDLGNVVPLDMKALE